MKRILVFMSLVFRGACTLGPDYKGPPDSAAGAPGGKFVRADDPTFSASPAVSQWWESLNDPALNSLVEEALARSPNIEVAQARIKDARTQITSRQADMLPSLSANAVYLHARLPGSALAGLTDSNSESSSSSSALNFYNLGTNASWEPDLFGGGRRGIEQARAALGQQFAALADAQVSLSAQVAQAYVNLRDVQERARLNVQSAELQRRALALTRQRHVAGTASALDVERLSSQLETTDAQNLPLAAQIADYMDQLAVLTGHEPGTLDVNLSAATPVPLPPASIAIGDPAALIAHRPDVRSAERVLAARYASIGISEAKRFPSLRFTGIFGLGGSELRDVVNTDNFTALLVPTLSWSFVDFGKARAAVRQSEAQRDEADATYRQTVLDALRDAESSLSRFGNVRLQLAQLARAEATVARSVDLNNQRVKAGTSSLIDQLDIERQRYSAAISVAQAKAQLTGAFISVNKALGLGWTDESLAGR